MNTIQTFLLENKSIVNIVVVAIIFTFTLAAGKFIKYTVSNLIIKKTGDEITGNFVGRIFSIIVFATGILLCLEKLGLKSFSNKILAGAGLTTFIIGFALKDIGENFLAGIVLALNKPFRVGDIIQVDSIIGEVASVTLRETTIKTNDGKDIYIPNSKLITSPLTNYTVDGFQRFELKIEIEGYTSDTNILMQNIKDVINEHKSVIEKKEKVTDVHLVQIKQQNMSFLLYYWLYDFHFNMNEEQIKTTIMLQLKDYFNQNNIKLVSIT
jgi:small-conductance mechanosensitive channel